MTIKSADPEKTVIRICFYTLILYHSGCHVGNTCTTVFLDPLCNCKMLESKLVSKQAKQKLCELIQPGFKKHSASD